MPPKRGIERNAWDGVEIASEKLVALWVAGGRLMGDGLIPVDTYSPVVFPLVSLRYPQKFDQLNSWPQPATSARGMIETIRAGCEPTFRRIEDVPALNTRPAEPDAANALPYDPMAEHYNEELRRATV